MIRRPPRSPLFPSTTLSRSAERRRGQRRRVRLTVPGLGHGLDSAEVAHARTAVAVEVGVEHLAPVPRPRQPDPVAGDRKSTRLNSSHANISYAVFCLKKKNT